MRHCSGPIGDYVWKPTPTRTPSVTINKLNIPKQRSGWRYCRIKVGKSQMRIMYCVLRKSCLTQYAIHNTHDALLGVQLLDYIGGDEDHALSNISRSVGQSFQRVRHIEQIDRAVELGWILASRVHHLRDDLVF